MTALSDARRALWTALTTSPNAEAPWRIHEWAPDQLVAPCIYIANAEVDRTVVGSPGVSVILARFPIYCAADGKPEQQSRRLDQMTAFVWDAAIAAGAIPDNSRPAAIDVGGSSLRGVLVQVDMTIRALTLCTPTLEVPTHG